MRGVYRTKLSQLALTALGLGSAAWLLVPGAQAATVSFQQGTGGYSGAVDTQLHGGSANAGTQYATATSILVDNSDASGVVQGLLRFDNIIGSGPGQVPSGENIVSAELILRSTSGNAQSAGNVTLHRMVIPWAATDTWNSLTAGITADGSEAAAAADVTIRPNFADPGGNLANTRQVTADVTEAVRAWISGAANYGWVLRNDNSDGYRFDSSDHTTITNRPRLVITYGQADPPVITQQPITSTNVVECNPFTLSVAVTGTGPLQYQWTKAGANIPDATNASYTVARAQLSDTEANYAVNVSGPGGAVQSNPSAVNVTEDAGSPTVVNVLGEGNRTNIVITFSEPLKLPADQTEQDNLVFTYTLQNSLGLSPQIATNFITANGLTLMIQLTEPRNLDDPLIFGITGFDGIPLYEACRTDRYVAPVTKPVLSSFPIFGYSKTWSYEASGTDQGIAWREASFNDSAWGSGPGIFDAANSPRATVGGMTVGTSLPRTNSTSIYTNTAIPTYYFRTHFDYPANAGGVMITPFIDDASIIYINGVEVARTGIPAGTATSFAAYSEALGQTAAVGTAAPGTAIVVTSGLNAGDNVIAVEVKQINSGSSDMDFGISMDVITDTRPACVINIERQPANATVVEGGNTTLSVAATGQELQYQWFRGGSAIDGATTASLQLTNVTRASAEGDYTVRITTGCDAGLVVNSTAAHVTVSADVVPIRVLAAIADTVANTVTVSFAKTNGSRFTLSPTSAQTVGNYSLSPNVAINSATIENGTNVVLQTGALQPVAYTLTITGVKDATETGNLITPNPSTVQLSTQVRVLSFNQTWKYDQSGGDLGTDWRAPGFNDGAWSSGSGFLALETSTDPLNLMISLAPPSGINTPLSLNGTNGTQMITYYFRTTFNNPITDLSTAKLNLRALVDDGAVFYLNGTQVHVFNISTSNPITFSTPASGAATEGALITATNLPGLVAGQNTLAVEVHQNNNTSSDIVFGAELSVVVGGGSVAEPARLTTAVTPTGITLSWDKAGTLQETTTIANPASWVNSQSQANPQTITPGGAMKFYRVIGQ